jgi:hypothetical protein
MALDEDYAPEQLELSSGADKGEAALDAKRDNLLRLLTLTVMTANHFLRAFASPRLK